ncbi:MAG: hypothetical protein SFY66_10730 [Oculatellaceae cyanobacterium bins.114]|nr:hypothetical protein [Oculatellaceae cyanobacterium bins.114]
MSKPSLTQLVDVFCRTEEDDFDLAYSSIRELLSRHSAAVILKTVASALLDELQEETTLANKDDLSMYGNALDDLVERLYKGS